VRLRPLRLLRQFRAPLATTCCTAMLALLPTLPVVPSTASSRDDATVIAKLRSDWAADLHGKRLDDIAALYAADAIFLEPTGARVMGRAAIRDLCKTVMAKFTSSIRLHSVATRRSGSLAYDTGDYDESLLQLADSSTVEEHGSYVMVFGRDAGGRWLILEQAWTDASPHK
jgi:ketosteroid isomerase-like protein